MNRFQKIGFFLSGSPADDTVIAYAAHAAEMGSKDLHCVLIHDDSPGAAAGNISADAVRPKVNAAMPAGVADAVSYDDHSDQGLVDVLRTARDLNLDLAIIGRRLPSNQMSIGPKIARIARKVPCSVMVVPEMRQPHFARIMVAVDCSDHSRLALEAAVSLAKAAGNETPQIVAVTVRRVTSRHELAGVTFQEAAEAQMKYGKRDLEEFLATIPSDGITIEPLVTLAEDIGSAISQLAMAHKMDVLVVGSRGTTMPAAALLGSTSEQILLHTAMPMLIVKEKGETLNLLEALFSTN